MEILVKNEIRRIIKESRQALNPHQEELWNREVSKKVLDLVSIRQAFCVYCYVSLRHETGTELIIRSLLEQGKCVAVPRIFENRMDFYAIHGKKDLEKGIMGILEPKASCIRICDPCAPVIVPGLAFDDAGRRIGYGGGFYDGFFEEEPNHLKIGIAYGFQIFDSLPTGCHDKNMNMVITP